jgi:putative ABC transport system permease protein
MNFIALKMLIGDRAKYIGIIIGLTFASRLITQQSAIFVGIMTRTFSFLTDVGLPDIWVVDPQVQCIEGIKPLRDTEVLRAGNDIFTTAAKDVVACGGKSQAWTRPARSM